ncbi:MAG: GAF domain-containing protein [Chloroflexi bacterium]|nr:GAF domain-containing protein [Chloroflexota bacterium]
MSPYQLTNRAKWTMTIVSMAVYIICAAWLVETYGASIFIAGVIPVSFIGFLFGTTGGAGAAVSLIFINVLLAFWLKGNPSATLFDGSFLSVCIILLFVGTLTGRLRQSIENRLQKEIELLSRERYLSLLNDMTRSIIASTSPDVMMGVLIKDLKILLEADDCTLTRWNDDLKKAIPLSPSATFEKNSRHFEIPSQQVSMTKSVISEGRVIATEDVTNSPYASPEIAGHFRPRSMLGIPLSYGQIKLGAILLAYHTPHKFTKEELERGEQAGNQIAIALWNAQQDFELQQRLKESDALTSIARALSQSERIGLSNLLELIASSAKELISGAEQAVIHLLDEDERFLVAEAVAGIIDTANGKTKMRLGEGVAGQVLAEGTTINILDITTDDRFIKLGGVPLFHSLMVAPIISGGRKLGTISVQSSLAQVFTDNEKNLLSTLGIHAAIAIENANLLESTQQALKETDSLYQINQGLVALNADELLSAVTDLLQKNFGYYHVQVYIIDPPTGDFILQAGSGEIGQKLKEQNYRLPAGSGIMGYAAETSASFFTNNVDEVMFFLRNPYLPETRSEMAIPVKIGGQILGILDIQQAPPKIFTNRDLQIISAVADQLAIALQKAGLYEDLQTSLHHEKTARNQLVQNERLAVMGRLLASVSHELNNPLQAIQNALFLLKAERNLSLQGQQDLDIVLSEAERMAAMIERLRATYRPIQAEDFTPVQINNVVEDVYALISTHLRHNNISFEFHPDPALPSIPALGDQIRQVILNLLMNAVESVVDSGRLNVSTKYIESNSEVFLSISDNGDGIDPSILPNIFEAFITNKERGTGLGLTISYDIILKHHGRITAENNSAGGATFNVWLPTRRMETP